MLLHILIFILQGFLNKCWKSILFTQMLFLKDSILNRPITSNVISNSQSVNADVSSLSRSNPSAR